MTDLKHPHAKRAAKAGMSAFQAFRAAHVPAKLAARVPVVGPILGLIVLAGATAVGAVSGFTDEEQ
jgi:hypothetical protein